MSDQPLPASANAASLDTTVRPPSLHAALMAGGIALFAWVAFAGQADIAFQRMQWHGGDALGALNRFSAYLTNLTVLMVAISFTCIALRVRAWPWRLLREPAAVSAVSAYIVFVGIAYNVLLRRLWTPHGYHAVVNESVHTVLPLLCGVYWLWFVPQFTLSARQRLSWLVYPLVYFVLTFWRGSETGFYPYPFIDIDEIGYAYVLINSVMMLAAFIVLMAIFMAINARRRPAGGKAGTSAAMNLRQPD
jgi:hypothetical protein